MFSLEVFPLHDANSPTTHRVMVLLAIEYCWNVYPSTTASSLLLHACHATLLAGLLWPSHPPSRQSGDKTQ